METAQATEASKTQLENIVSGLVSDKLSSSTVSIASKKYLTRDNELVYVTLCLMSGATIPRIRVQVFHRVENGVREEAFALYGDHRLEKTGNDMIFGRRTEGPSASAAPIPVSEEELGRIIALLSSLGPENQTL